MINTVTISVEEYDRLKRDSKALTDEKQSKNHTITLRFYESEKLYPRQYSLYVSHSKSKPEINEALDELKVEFNSEISAIIEKCKDVESENAKYKFICIQQELILSRIPKWIVKFFKR